MNVHKIQQILQIVIVDATLVFDLDWHDLTIHFQNNAHFMLLSIPGICDVFDFQQSSELFYCQKI